MSSNIKLFRVLSVYHLDICLIEIFALMNYKLKNNIQSFLFLGSIKTLKFMVKFFKK